MVLRSRSVCSKTGAVTPYPLGCGRGARHVAACASGRTVRYSNTMSVRTVTSPPANGGTWSCRNLALMHSISCAPGTPCTADVVALPDDPRNVTATRAVPTRPDSPRQRARARVVARWMAALMSFSAVGEGAPSKVGPPSRVRPKAGTPSALLETVASGGCAGVVGGCGRAGASLNSGAEVELEAAPWAMLRALDRPTKNPTSAAEKMQALATFHCWADGACERQRSGRGSSGTMATPNADAGGSDIEGVAGREGGKAYAGGTGGGRLTGRSGGSDDLAGGEGRSRGASGGIEGRPCRKVGPPGGSDDRAGGSDRPDGNELRWGESEGALGGFEGRSNIAYSRF